MGFFLATPEMHPPFSFVTLAGKPLTFISPYGKKVCLIPAHWTGALSYITEYLCV